MSFFSNLFKKKKKPSNPYTLRPVDYNIDDLPSEPRGQFEPICKIIGETDQYTFYHYYYSRTDGEHTKGSVLRRSKSNPSDLRDLTGKQAFSCIFQNRLFQCDHNGIRRFFVMAYDIETGEIEYYHWFGEEFIFLCFDDGHTTAISQDYVNDMYVKDDELIIETFRSEPGGGYNRVPTGKTNHIIRVRYEDAQFVKTDVDLNT